MSLYEVISMNVALEKMDQKHRPTVSDEEFEAARDMLASVTANDPNVRLH